MDTTKYGELVKTVLAWLTGTGLKVLVAVLVLIISFKIINVIARRLEKRNKRVDKTIIRTLINLGKGILKVLIALCLVGYLGIDTSGLTALVTSLGVCVGLAVNGTLSNLASGVMLIFVRPFKIDDFVEIGGVSGTIENIGIVTTKIRMLDNRTIYVPNSSVTSSTIVNYSEQPTRRVDLTFSISYHNDFEKAKTILSRLADRHDLVLKTPAPTIRVLAHNESSIDLCCRVWVNTPDYWTVYFDLLEQTKKAFDQEGIEIPFKQVDVHMISKEQ